MEILTKDLMVYILSKTVKSFKYCDPVTGSVLLSIGGDVCRRRSIWVSASIFASLQVQIPHMMRADLGGNKPRMPQGELEMAEHFYRRFNLSFINTCRMEFLQGQTMCCGDDDGFGFIEEDNYYEGCDDDDDFREHGEVFVSPSKLLDILSTTP